MTTQVLARKWRPRNFQEMVGQDVVQRALKNALDNQRLHHAYLFTGTRGVGKTSVARILAKCLNCEKGISATPCGTCTACVEIDQGRFVDLIEVDAASRTKVEDTRELLENVQYAPSSGRFKIYLIDEVHMLSGHSFNALLKTLEEPPPHVKFLLATTDPQRLPVTVLSRCLQFHLKNMAPEIISAHLQYILTQEKISFEEAGLASIARAADGSMRDALSLLDQAIAYGGGALRKEDVNLMLGTLDQHHVERIISALVARDPVTLISTINDVLDQGADAEQTLEQLLSILHRIALTQVLPGAISEHEGGKEQLETFAKSLSKEDIQLFYQIALIGRRDLALAPTARSGLEMIALRMLAFQPAAMGEQKTAAASLVPTPSSPPSPTVPIKIPASSDPWSTLLAQLNLSGMTLAVANNCTLQEMSENQVVLALDPAHKTMLNPTHQERISQALQQHLGKATTVKIVINTATDAPTPALLQKRAQEQRQQSAVNSIENDQNVRAIVDTFGAKIHAGAITAQEKG